MAIYLNFNSKQSGCVNSVEIQRGTQQTRFQLLDLCDLRIVVIIVLCTITEE